MKRRKNERRTVWGAALLGALLVALPLAAAPEGEAPAPIATEQLGGTILGLTPQIAYESAVLRVAGPDRYALSKRFNDSASIHVDLLAEAESRRVEDEQAGAITEQRASLPDGRYRYEVVFTVTTGQTRTHTGLFFVQGGGTVPRDAMRSQVGTTASDLGATGAAPEGSRTEPGVVADNAPARAPLLTSHDDHVNILDTANDGETVLHLPSDLGNGWWFRNQDGDLQWQERSGVNVTRMALLEGGNLGLGTTAPADELHITDGVPTIRLEDSDSGGATFLLQSIQGAPQFEIFDDDNNTIPFIVQSGAPSSTVVLRSTGQVGIGTDTPQATLELAPGGGNAAFRLNAPGAGGETWAVSNTGSIVTFNMIGSGGQEATFRERLDGSGLPTFQVQGSIQATNVSFSSSRALKTAFEAVDPAEMLAKIGELEISEWQYKEGSPGRHIGPVAEDFQAMFGLGDGETISVVDVQGVALAAIQGLQTTLEARDQRIADLEARLAQLERLLPESADP